MARAGGDVVAALMAYWEGGELSSDAEQRLRELHGQIGFGSFQQWLDYLFGLYLNQFPDFEYWARRMPRVQRPWYIPQLYSMMR